jgi:hypothetical protein
MWWEPRHEDEYGVSRAVTVLRDWFGGPRNRENPFAWGYGSVWSPGVGALAPLILLNAESLELEPRGRTEFKQSIQLLLANEVDNLNGFRGDQYLRGLAYEFRVHFLPVRRPRSSSLHQEIFRRYLPIRGPIVCGRTGKLGSPGISVWDATNAEPGFLTAGHVFPEGVDSTVMLPGSFFWPFRRQIGEVSHHVVPKGNAYGWDAAVVRHRPRTFFWSPAARRVLGRFRRPEPVVVHGAISGSVSQAAVLQGALEQVQSDAMNWTNCWMIGPSGVLTSGDSGASVFTRSDAAWLGTFVGSSYFRSGNAPFIHYVQDGESLERTVLAHWGVQLRRGP